MKKYCFLILIASITLFTTSCSGKYDNVISDYILVADTLNAKTGIKINEVKELKKITVGDSITYINHKAEQGLRLQVENVEKQLASYQEDLVKANSGAAGKIIVEAYTNQIVRTKQTIDSLKTIKPEPTKLYEGKKTEEILALVLECKYTITDASSGNKIDATKNFVLSSDGKVCYGTTDNPDLNIQN